MLPLADRKHDDIAVGADCYWTSPAATAQVAHLMGMNTHETALSRLEPLLSVGELAEYLGVPVRTIYDWRQSGHGPRGLRIGRHLKFMMSDVTQWVEAQRDASACSER